MKLKDFKMNYVFWIGVFLFVMPLWNTFSTRTNLIVLGAAVVLIFVSGFIGNKKEKNIIEDEKEEKEIND